MERATKRLFLFRPTLGGGGADRVSITLLQHLDRGVFEPTLVLVKRNGVLLDQVPGDVPVIELGVRRLRFACQKLARVLRRERPDVLLSTSSGGNLVASLAHRLAADPRRRLVLSQRSTYSMVRRELRSRWMPVTTVTRALYQQADRIVAVSKGVADDLVESLGLPQELVVPIHNPVVGEELQELSEHRADHRWFEDEPPVLLAVGRLVPQKDYPVLLQAFARIRQQRRVRLIVLGEGELRGDLEKLAKRLGIGDDVDFPGFEKNPFSYMRRCTVYVLSSRSEGLPGALIQAMACGAAVVSTDCPFGPGEIIEHGSNGFLVPVGDVDGLAKAIETLLDDPALRRSFSEAARKSTARFAVSPMVRQYEDVLLSS